MNKIQVLEMLSQTARSSTFYCISNLKYEEIDTALFGMATNEDSLVYRQDGIEGFIENNKGVDEKAFVNGRFSLILKREADVVVKSDYFGMDPIFYYNVDGVWFVSNSLLLLCREIKNSGRRFRFNNDSLAAYSLLENGLYTQQQAADQTICEDILVLPIGQKIVCDRNSLKVVPYDLPPSPLADLNYEDSLHYLVSTLSRRMAASRKLINREVYADLSGGQDSRLIFGICANSKKLSGEIWGKSIRNKIDDFAVAEKIARVYRINLRSGVKTNHVRPNADEAMEIWKTGNCGYYKPVYYPSGLVPRHMIQFAGGNFIGSAYNSNTGTEVLSFLVNGVRDDIAKQAGQHWEDALSRFGVPLDGTEVMEKHYLHNRCRFHYGRDGGLQLQSTLMSPLICTEFLDVYDRFGTDKNQTMSDVLQIVDGRLIDFPFSSKKSSLSDAVRASSKERIRTRPLDETPELRVFGSIPDGTGDPNKPDVGVEFNKAFLAAYEAATSSSAVRSLYSGQELNLLRKGLIEGKRNAVFQAKASTMISIAEFEKLSN